ncbi:trans-2,3-dihydro-3-hydroxyanthranilate isomerase [Silvibacterium bohemicum]|uniref:Trans-2,3-dihydro-3-hydroxyanthranilate isomerase n=1 Tax=Silvibacterium bohemicum TaxID=1577686 RepID=A0A841K8Y6_9BACT|nr:PhzF family phenazine biosynthesis protein [Silvibacterium bohemicum]MBB6147018.1 trans-2,3-dihydro-3-hydroxyanthranilate isomerase [Silvibacterium bohemicum]
MREFEYQLCDVFTARRLEGNQLAVFLDAGNLSDAEMQALARETNLSETTFLCRRDAATESERGVRVRIFTTEEELPFAGHPTLGTAATIRSLFPEFQGAGKIVLDLKAGQVPVVFHPEKSTVTAAFGRMTQPQPVFGRLHDAAEIAPLLGLRKEDLEPDRTPQTVSTGLPFCVVVLRSVEALTRMRLQGAASEEYFQRAENSDAQGPHAKFFYALAAEAPGRWRARMQFYNGEDPATGSAAGCAISYLVQHGVVPAGEEVHLQQGIEIHRASDIYATANLLDGKVGEVHVGGSTVLVAKGRFFLE